MSHAPTLSITPRPEGGWQLRCELLLPRPIDEVFPFFADAHNLEAITPSTVRFHVLTPRPIEMRPGLRIDYRLRIKGLPVRWQSEIPVWDPPHRFVDRQTRGPYRLWHHEHTFEPADHGRATLVRDRVDYLPRGGPLAPLLNAAFIQRDLTRIFEHRSRVLAAHFATDPLPTPSQGVSAGSPHPDT